LVLAGCGPSFQATYECDVHFEHCYALDESGASVQAKKDCWRDWLKGYTYGQSRDRVEYGGTRYSQLSLDPTLPSEETQSKRAVAAPVPTSAFAPPPNVMGDGHAEHPSDSVQQRSEIRAGDVKPADYRPSGEVAGSPVSSVSRAPGADCADTCGQKWTACRSSCKEGACGTCDQAYRACMPTCFRDDGGSPQKAAVRSVR